MIRIDSLSLEQPLIEQQTQPRSRISVLKSHLWNCAKKVCNAFTSCLRSKKTAYAGILASSALMIFSGDDRLVYTGTFLTGSLIQRVCNLRYPKGLHLSQTIDNSSMFGWLENKVVRIILVGQELYSHPFSRLATMLSPISIKAKFVVIIGTGGMLIVLRIHKLMNKEQTDQQNIVHKIGCKIVIIDSLIVAMGSLESFYLSQFFSHPIAIKICQEIGLAIASRPLGYYTICILNKVLNSIQKFKNCCCKTATLSLKIFKFILETTSIPIGCGFLMYSYASPLAGMAMIGAADGIKNWTRQVTTLNEIEETDLEIPLSEEQIALSTCKKIQNWVKSNFFTIALLAFAVQDIADPNTNSLPYQGALVILPGLFIYYLRKGSRIACKQFKFPDKYIQEGIWFSMYLSRFKEFIPLKITALILTGAVIGQVQELIFYNKKRNKDIPKETPNFVRFGALVDLPSNVLS